MKDEVYAFQLTSGIQVIGRILKIDDLFFLVANPFEMMYSLDQAGNNRLYFSRWLPFNKPSYEVVIFNSGVEAMTKADTNFVAYYEQKIKQFDKLAKGDVDEYDPHDEESEEKPVKAPTKGNTTVH
jgi:hypothetical protein